MTFKVEIYPGLDFPVGWVQMEPFDYEYNGEDPNGEIEQYLSDIESGEITFSWGADAEPPSEDVPANLAIFDIVQTLQSFDEIWYVEFPDDFEPHSLME